MAAKLKGGFKALVTGLNKIIFCGPLGNENASHNNRQINDEDSTLNSNRKDAKSWIEAIRKFIFDDEDNTEHGTYILDGSSEHEGSEIGI